MKVVLGLLVLVAVGWAGMYFFGGYGSFDATAQGKDNKTKIGPGMSHTQVFAITDNPRKYRIINRHVKRIGGEEVESFDPSNEVDFDRARIDQRILDGSLPHGFCCTFRYSDSMAFTVYFDGTGTVKGVTDAMTMADLLDQRE
jgi:hypothetical protein